MSIRDFARAFWAERNLNIGETATPLPYPKGSQGRRLVVNSKHAGTLRQAQWPEGLGTFTQFGTLRQAQCPEGLDTFSHFGTLR